MFMFRTAAATGVALLLSIQSSRAQSIETLRLADAVSIALQSNPEVQIALQEIDAAEGRILQAGRMPNTELGISWSEAASPISIIGANELDIGLSQTFEYPTKVRQRSDVATIDRQLAETRVESVRRRIAHQVTRECYRLVHARSVAANLRQLVEQLNDARATMTSRFAQQQSSYLDGVRTSIEIARVGADILQAVRTVRQHEGSLNALLGRAAESPLFLLDSLPPVQEAPQRDTLLGALVQRSAALALARLLLNRQEQALALARTAALPDFGVGISHQQHASVSKHWGMDVRMSLPMWFSSEPRGEVREAEAAIAMAATGLAQTELRVRASIVRAADALHSAIAHRQLFTVSLERDMQDALAIAVAQYRNGQLDVLNLLDVYRSVRAARAEYSTIVYDAVQAMVDLEYAGELEELH
jgi:cobalt-zinc-cadmium efflux system outer membrane protein